MGGGGEGRNSEKVSLPLSLASQGKQLSPVLSWSCFCPSEMIGYSCCPYSFYAFFFFFGRCKGKNKYTEEDTDTAFAGSLSNVNFSLLINSHLKSS